MSAKAATLLVGGKPTPLADVVQQALGDSVQLRAVKSRRIASLWSGYGSISEVTAETADGKKLQLIAKQVRGRVCCCRAAGTAKRPCFSLMHEQTH